MLLFIFSRKSVIYKRDTAGHIASKNIGRLLFILNQYTLTFQNSLIITAEE
jgi:hypothetical protein